MSKVSTRHAEAFAYGLAFHREQVRKGTEFPYVAHLMAVSGIVLEHCGSEAEAIASLVDAYRFARCGITEERLQAELGRVVSDLQSSMATAPNEGEPNQEV